MSKTIKWSFEWNDSQKVGHINYLMYDVIKNIKYWRHSKGSNGWYTIKEFENYNKALDFGSDYADNKTTIK